MAAGHWDFYNFTKKIIKIFKKDQNDKSLEEVLLCDNPKKTVFTFTKVNMNTFDCGQIGANLEHLV